MENQPPSNDGTPENNSGNGDSAQLKLTFDYPDYKAWYPDTEKYEAQESNYWFRQNVISSLGLFINVLTLAGAVAGVWIAYNAFQTSNKAVVEARNQTTEAKRQANEAKRQADAAESQIAIAADTEHRQLRAYVFAEFVGFGNLTPATPIDVLLHIRNIGQTPAYNAKSVSGINLLSYPLAPQSHFETTSGPPNSAVVYPSGYIVVTKRAERPYTNEEIAEIINGTAKRIYVAGKITYTDIFGVDQWTEFCIALGGPALIPGVKQVTPDLFATLTGFAGRYEYCPEHNNGS